MAVKIFSGRSTTYLAEKIANEYGEPLGKVNYQQFSDGEMSPFLTESVRGHEVFIIQSTFPPADNLLELLLMVDASLVDAKTLKSQRDLWELFSFEHLPVEVISHLYQRFVDGSTAVYTPPFLAALLLDFAMPYEKLTGKERILDPACGSGVFLVGAFRRLINVWRSKHNWKRPDVETLKSILKQQIFGVEMDAGAVDLTAFSLALAVCDSLHPNVIWNELRFDRLRDKNLLEGDFFEFALADLQGNTACSGAPQCASHRCRRRWLLRRAQSPSWSGIPRSTSRPGLVQ